MASSIGALTFLVEDPIDVSARELSGVPIDSWMAAREDSRDFEKQLHSTTQPSPQTFGSNSTAENGPSVTILCQPTLLTGIEPADPAREQLVLALEDGFEELTGKILDSIMSNQNTVAGIWKEKALKSCWRILLSTDSRVLRSLLEGNLVKNDHTSKDTRTALSKLCSRAKREEQPCIYANFFTAKDGSPQSAKETHEILNEMERYADISRNSTEDLDHAFKIDTVVQSIHPNANKWLEQYTSEGYRRYLASSPSTCPPQTAYLNSLARFISVVRQRLGQLCVDDLEKPLEPCFSEVEYTAKSEARLKEHRSHASSNRLMNLFEAVSITLYGEQYRIRQYVLYLIWDSAQTSMAEIIFTFLSNSFVGGGNGFTFCNPGISVDSVSQINDMRWQVFIEWAMNNSPYVINNQLEKCRMEELVQEEERLKTEISKIEFGKAALRSDSDMAQTSVPAHGRQHSEQGETDQDWLKEQAQTLRTLSIRAKDLLSLFDSSTST